MTRPARRLVPIRAALALLAAIPVTSPIVSSAASGTALAQGTETRAGITARIEQHLNSINTLRARFLQISPAGEISRGTVLMSRPGKLRIDYDPRFRFSSSPRAAG